MPWDVHLLHSVVLLVLLQRDNVNAVSQESVYVIECIRDMVPNQIFNDCCMRENNCSLTRQQNKGIDCMSRMIMSNYSYIFSDAHDGGQMTTEYPHQQPQDRNQQRWYTDILETLAEICKRQTKGRIQSCIRNELIKRCRYSMLQDRITSPPGRWNQRPGDRFGGGDRGYGSGGRQESRRRLHQLHGNRRNHDDGTGYHDSRYHGSSDCNNHRQLSRISYNNDDDTDKEDFGYSDGDSDKY